MFDDTIAAIATALSPSGIGIIRISGTDAITIANTIFRSNYNKDLTTCESHRIYYGKIIEPVKKRVIDEVLVTIMRGPNSYTMEDVVEINCHGGVIVLQKVLKLVLSQGARMSEPGEFTKRAFLNGRIDLSQAEAVIDIINSSTDMALQSSVNHLSGALSNKVDVIKNNLITLIAHIEASIDYPEYDIDDLSNDRILASIGEIKKGISILSDSYDNGRIIHEGIKTVIVGKPNVGKSSLLNALLDEQRAIVTDIPGTTRDVLEEYMNLNGIPLRLIDTAGIRETVDAVEKIGVERSRENIDKADLVLFVVDASVGFNEEDQKIYDLLKDKKSIILMNKIDLDKAISKEDLQTMLEHSDIIEVSVKEQEGLDQLVHSIHKAFNLGTINFNDQVYVTSVRHKHALEKAMKALNEVIEGIEQGMPVDFLAIDLKNVYDAIGELTGESVSEDLINQIFSQFCLGK